MSASETSIVPQVPQAAPSGGLSVPDFAKKIKQRYPDYSEVDDFDLAKRVLAKYPQYYDNLDAEHPSFKLLGASLQSDTDAAYQKQQGVKAQLDAAEKSLFVDKPAVPISTARSAMPSVTRSVTVPVKVPGATRLTPRIAEQLSPPEGQTVNPTALDDRPGTSYSDMKRGEYDRSLTTGELRQRDEGAVANSEFVRARQAKEAGAAALRANPMSAEARGYDPRENVAETAERKQDVVSKEIDWHEKHESAIAALSQRFRGEIQKRHGLGDPQKWLNETATQIISGLSEYPAAFSDRMRVMSEAARRAAEEEGADRSGASKFAQATVAGLVSSAPEMAAMTFGAPAIAAFGIGGGMRAAGTGRDVFEGAGHGAALGAAFDLPVPNIANPLAKAAARSGIVGTGATAVELAAGQPLKQAAQSGLTTGVLAGGFGLLHGQGHGPPRAIKDGEIFLSDSGWLAQAKGDYPADQPRQIYKPKTEADNTPQSQQVQAEQSLGVPSLESRAAPEVSSDTPTEGPLHQATVDALANVYPDADGIKRPRIPYATDADVTEGQRILDGLPKNAVIEDGHGNRWAVRGEGRHRHIVMLDGRGEELAVVEGGGDAARTMMRSRVVGPEAASAKPVESQVLSPEDWSGESDAPIMVDGKPMRPTVSVARTEDGRWRITRAKLHDDTTGLYRQIDAAEGDQTFPTEDEARRYAVDQIRTVLGDKLPASTPNALLGEADSASNPSPVQPEPIQVEAAKPSAVEPQIVRPWEMSRTEIEEEFQRKKAAGDNLEASILGPELAKRYAQLQRSANSMYDTEKADRAQKEIEKIEASLSERDRNRLYGIGETGPQLDDLRNYRQSLGNLDNSDPQSLAESMRWAVSRVGNETDPLKMSHDQQVAYGTLREAARIAHDNGWDTQAISREAVRAAGQRFSDPEDAAFMLDRFLKKESPPQRPAPKLIEKPSTEQADSPQAQAAERAPVIEPSQVLSPEDWSGESDAPIMVDGKPMRPTVSVARTEDGRWRITRAKLHDDTTGLYRQIDAAEGDQTFPTEDEARRYAVDQIRTVLGDKLPASTPNALLGEADSTPRSVEQPGPTDDVRVNPDGSREWIDETGRLHVQSAEQVRQAEGAQPKNASPVIEPPNQAGVAPEVPSETTSIKHAVVNAERMMRGLPEFTTARRAHPEMFDEGVHAVETGKIDPRALANAIIEEPRPLSTKESMALLYDRMRISNGKEDASSELLRAQQSGDPQEVAAALDKVSEWERAAQANDEADYRAGTEQGRGLAIRRLLINRDYSLGRQQAKLIARNRGKALPEDVQTQLEDFTSKLEEANKRISELEKNQPSPAVEKYVREQKLDIRQRGRQRTRAVLVAERAEIKQQVAQAWAKMKPKSTTLSMGGLGDLDPNGELSRAIGKLARNYIEDGITRAADVVDAVHGHLKDVSDLSKREVSELLTNYGRVRERTPDVIEKKLNEIKSIVASNLGKADVLEKGIRPKRRGETPDKPTEDQRRSLREMHEAVRDNAVKLGEKPYDVKTEQATPLDKAKTTARNRGEQLRKWLADGKREVQGKQKVLTDAELEGIRKENVALEKAVALLDDPAADQKAIERRLGELDKSIVELRSRIRSGKFDAEVKEGAKSLWSKEIGEAQREQSALRSIMSYLRTEKAKQVRETELNTPANFYGAEKSWAAFEAEARKVINRQKSQARQWDKRVASLQSERSSMQKTNQRSVKAVRTPTPETGEVKIAKRNAKVLQSQIDQLGNVIDWRNKEWYEKILPYAAQGTRAAILSGVRTVGKIGSALGQSAAQQYMGEVAGVGARRLFPRTASLAPRHGRSISLASEGEFARGVGQGVKDIPRALRSGETSLTLEQGKRYPQIPTKMGTVLSVPGRLHMAEKNIIGSGEYSRAKEMFLQHAEAMSEGARDSPDVQERAGEYAYKHAEEIMMLGTNPFSRMMQGARRMLGFQGSQISRIVVPVERVPSNYLFGQLIGEYGLGLPRGLARATAAELRLRGELRRAVKDTSEHYMDGTMQEAVKELSRKNPGLMEKMSPEEADKTMRLIKRGSVGLIYMALGGLAGAGTGKVALGGYYGGAGDRADVHPGDLKIGPVTVPHWLLHSPPNELANFTSTMKREIQSRVAKSKGKPAATRTLTGAVTATKGVVKQVPFFNEYTDTVNSLRSGEEFSTKMGRWLASRIEPQIVQELSHAIDREEKGKPTRVPFAGEAVERKAKGFTESLVVNLPIARERIRKDRKKMAEMRRQNRSVTPPVPTLSPSP